MPFIFPSKQKEKMITLNIERNTKHEDGIYCNECDLLHAEHDVCRHCGLCLDCCADSFCEFCESCSMVDCSCKTCNNCKKICACRAPRDCIILPSSIRKLQSYGYKGLKCPICLESIEFVSGLDLFKVNRTLCGHIYHHSCLDTWCNNKYECPMCREIPGLLTPNNNNVPIESIMCRIFGDKIIKV